MTWIKKLTKKELVHVIEDCGGTLEGFKRNREKQLEMVQKNPDGMEPCWDCKFIAKKLGLE